MKKTIASILTCTLLTPIYLSTMGSPVFAQKEDQNSSKQSIQEETNREGLLGYYFKGADFNDLITFAPTVKDTLLYHTQTADVLLGSEQQTYKSIRWIGFIKSEEAGNFTFKLSEDENAIIEIDGNVVSNLGKEKQSVYLEKGQLIPIRIEYKPNETLKKDSQKLKELKLYKIDDKNQTTLIKQADLRNPHYRTEASRSKLTNPIRKTLFPIQSKKIDNEFLDTDNDNIPDDWEINGYTIQNKVAVKWKDDLAEKGYTKFTSNPLEAYTAGDPYNDYEKAARSLDVSNAKETFHPLVAAFPSVNVSLENIILSENKDLSKSVGSNSSNNWSYTNTEGVSGSAGFGSNGFSFGVSANYQHSDTVGAQWGHSNEDTSHINNAESAFLNANVRYNNVGTGSIYNVKPTVSFVLNGDNIGTIKAKENTTAKSIKAGESYPKLGQTGISINKMDDFGSSPIPLNKDQLTRFLNNVPIMLETNQVEGDYVTQNRNGKLEIGGEWSEVIPQIKERTASIIIDAGEKVAEKRIAAKDYTNPEDKTPSLTLKEALKLAYPTDVTEKKVGKDKLLFYKNQPIFESSVMTYVDENTSKEIEKQIKDETGVFKDVKKIYDVKLTPKMNFTIKPAVLYDGAEEGEEKLGVWTTQNKGEFGIIDSNPITGSHSFYSRSKETTLDLSEKSKSKLKKNKDYYFSIYMKAN
ncbi:binary toxin-like calcium binding domain-containing protein, partial [Bacillus cereus]|uniref:binary toxin-like calcium binding domain-containing protein n=1 Tax=Bacillus cereus TaxID=1396 RepID=UPI000BF584BF